MLRGVLLGIWMGLLQGCIVVAAPGPCATWWPDEDGDGWGDAANPVEICNPDGPTTGMVTRGEDCNDGDVAVNPGTRERCDTVDVDDDCDGLADASDPGPFVDAVDTWADEDGDGFGDPASEVVPSCASAPGRAANAGDCDDSSAATFPGAAERDSADACLTDEDDDGFGAIEGSGESGGTDCDDTAADVGPGAREILADDVDQNCDGLADASIVVDFEDEVSAWLSDLDGALRSDARADPPSGGWALAVPGDTTVVGRPLGTVQDRNTGVGCANLRWELQIARGPDGPDAGDSITLEVWDGSVFVPLATVGGLDGRTEPRWYQLGGLLSEEWAYREDFRWQLRTSEMAGDGVFLVDDVGFACTGNDGDADGFGEHVDCDDEDPRHWSDCGACIDTDDDGYGPGCDLGPDCGDEVPDPACEGRGPTGVAYDFDGAHPGLTLGGGAAVQPLELAGGLGALSVPGGGDAVLAVPAGGCDQVAWAMQARRGPPAPGSDEALALQWSDTSTRTQVFALQGGITDPGFVRYRGTIDDPFAMWPGLELRLAASGSGADAFYVDHFRATCDPIDADGDGWWAWLEDCDDGNTSVHPGADDPAFDGLDADCDGFDDGF